LAQRIIQFPIRNAFGRSHDSLARDTEYLDTQRHAHRIAQQVEVEIARKAERQATGRSAAFAAARNHDVIVMRSMSRIASLQAATLSFISKIFKPR
jgi:hypothetical protein